MVHVKPMRTVNLLSHLEIRNDRRRFKLLGKHGLSLKTGNAFFSEKSYHFQSSSTSFAEYPLSNSSFLKDSLFFLLNNDPRVILTAKQK